jgi:hypothetical protein
VLVANLRWMQLDFSGAMWFWRGPAPYHFVTVPERESVELHDVSSLVSYGWGVIPVVARIGSTSWSTSLFPKNGGYLVPIKASVRKVQDLELSDILQVTLVVEKVLAERSGRG